MITFFLRMIFVGGLCLSLSLMAEQGFDHSHDAFTALLKQNVKSIRAGQASQVDYAGLAKQRLALQGYLAVLAKVKRQQFDLFSRDEQLAFLINAYNAATLEFILTRYPNIQSIKDLGGLFTSPWSIKRVALLGETRSLDNIEHKLIRGSGRYNEPRIHFAINCASIGCPALQAEAFTARRLDAQLESSTRMFLADRTRNFISNSTLTLSKIFHWYGDDFKNAEQGESLATFLAHYHEALDLSEGQRQQLLANKLNINFGSYDWRLNDVR